MSSKKLSINKNIYIEISYLFSDLHRSRVENEGRPDRASLMEELRRPETSTGNCVKLGTRLVRNCSE